MQLKGIANNRGMQKRIADLDGAPTVDFVDRPQIQLEVLVYEPLLQQLPRHSAEKVSIPDEQLVRSGSGQNNPDPALGQVASQRDVQTGFLQDAPIDDFSCHDA